MQGIKNECKKDKSEEHDIQLVIAGKDTPKTLDSAKKTFNLIAEYVKGFIVFPRNFSIAFRRNNRCIAHFYGKTSGGVTLISLIHQQVNFTGGISQCGK